MLASALLLPFAPAAALAVAALPGQEDSLLIHAERVIVRPGKVLEDAAILVQNGVIVAVGPGLVAPEGTRELRGSVACAGFLDPWSSLGLDADSVTDQATTPATRSVDAYDPWNVPERRDETRRAGTTAGRVQAGVIAPVGGVGAFLRFDPGMDPEVILEDCCVNATVGITRGGKQPDVFDRYSEVEKLVSRIEKGRSYAESLVEYRIELEEWEKAIAEKKKELEEDFKKAKKKRDKGLAEAEEKGKKFKEGRYKEDKRPKKPKFDADSEVMGRVANGALPLVVEVHGSPEIRTLLEKTAELDRLRLVLAGATGAAGHAEELARRRIPVIVWAEPLGEQGRPELKQHDLSLAAQLADAGVDVLIGTGGGTDARDLRLTAALLVGHGLDAEAALAAITNEVAQAFDVGDRVGSLAPGRDADILLFDGDPLDTTSRLVQVVSRGRVVQ